MGANKAIIKIIGERMDEMYTGQGQVTVPRYLKIAMDLAVRIVSQEIHEGERLKGRSVLSAEYGVSPETIRRSISILSDKKVVKVYVGSGIVVASREKAIEFIKSFKDDESLSNMKADLSRLLESREALEREISSLTKRIVDMYQYMHTDLITPVEIVVPEQSHIIGKSIGELQVWHNTGATIIGVIQQDKVLISPGPYYAFSRGDHVLIVGDENVIERFNVFINDQQKMI